MPSYVVIILAITIFFSSSSSFAIDLKCTLSGPNQTNFTRIFNIWNGGKSVGKINGLEVGVGADVDSEKFGVSVMLPNRKRIASVPWQDKEFLLQTDMGEQKGTTQIHCVKTEIKTEALYQTPESCKALLPEKIGCYINEQDVTIDTKTHPVESFTGRSSDPQLVEGLRFKNVGKGSLIVYCYRARDVSYVVFDGENFAGGVTCALGFERVVRVLVRPVDVLLALEEFVPLGALAAVAVGLAGRVADGFVHDVPVVDHVVVAFDHGFDVQFEPRFEGLQAGGVAGGHACEHPSRRLAMPEQRVARHLHAVVACEVGDLVRLGPVEAGFGWMDVLDLHGVLGREMIEIRRNDLGQIVQVP